MHPNEFLKNVRTVLVIDWPSKDVPEALVLAGFQVYTQGGPGPTDYFVYEWNDGRIVARHVGHPPERAELVYSYRPFRELPQIIAKAKTLCAETIWTQSGLSLPPILRIQRAAGLQTRNWNPPVNSSNPRACVT